MAKKKRQAKKKKAPRRAAVNLSKVRVVECGGSFEIQNGDRKGKDKGK